MSDNTQMPVMLYTEQTPNPESIKYVLNRLLYKGTAEFKDAEAAKEWSPLAALLFEFPYVKNVYISNNFVTITKEFNYGWEEILLPVKEAIKKSVQDGVVPVNDGFEASKATQSLGGVPIEGDNPEIATRIKELIDTYVKPAVEGDGRFFCLFSPRFEQTQLFFIHIVNSLKSRTHTNRPRHRFYFKF